MLYHELQIKAKVVLSLYPFFIEKRLSMKEDITIGALFISGIWGFISGAFIVSTVLFAAAAMASNIFLRERVD